MLKISFGIRAGFHIYLCPNKVVNTMRESEILIKVGLDADGIPEKITWTASDKPEDAPQDTKAFALSFWDDKANAIMRIDLWTKELMVGEMKRFFIQSLGGMGETLLNATGDQRMYDEVNALCERLAQMLLEEEKAQKKS
jgi:gliding motility-associated protein GldC